MAKKLKIYTLSASARDERMLINMLETLGKRFPEYRNRMSVASFSGDSFSSRRFELSVSAEKRPSDEVKLAVWAFRYGWRMCAAWNAADENVRLAEKAEARG